MGDPKPLRLGRAHQSGSRSCFVPRSRVGPSSCVGSPPSRSSPWLRSISFWSTCLGLQWLKTGWAATLAASLFAFHWLPLGYGSTVYPRTVSTTCVLVAVLMIANTRRPVLGYRGGRRRDRRRFRLQVQRSDLPAADHRDAPPGKVSYRARRSASASHWARLPRRHLGHRRPLGSGHLGPSVFEPDRVRELHPHRQGKLVDGEYQPWNWYLWRLPKWLPS